MPTVTDTLNALTTDTHELVRQFKLAHWNVVSQNFQSLHELFDTIALYSYNVTDRLSERIKFYDVYAVGIAAKSDLPEFPIGATNDVQLLEHCLKLLLEIIKRLETGIKEFDSLSPTDGNILQDISAQYGQYVYFVRQHIKGYGKV
jgi:starvation-inducible DNA-binding protein